MSRSSVLRVFLFSDLFDSVGWQGLLGDRGYTDHLRKPHDQLFRKLLGEFSGHFHDQAGDGVFAHFDTPSAAVRYALAFHDAMAKLDWAEPVRKLRRVPAARVGIHLGEVAELAGPGGTTGLSGLAISLTARVMALGSGGQTSLTAHVRDSAVQFVDDLDLRWINVGFHSLKGTDRRYEVFEVRRRVPLHPWVDVPAGTYTVGTADPDAVALLAPGYYVSDQVLADIRNRRGGSRAVPAFRIGRGCVTNGEYWKYYKVHHGPRPTGWKGGPGLPFADAERDWPVVGVSFQEARTYCLTHGWRLPTWVEWQAAAAGPAGNPYPWGPTFDKQLCNGLETNRGRPRDVYDLPAGASPAGALQMSGNVSEWVVGPEGKPELRGGDYQRPCGFWGRTDTFLTVLAGSTGPATGFRVAAG